jgi:hypothetical protein
VILIIIYKMQAKERINYISEYLEKVFVSQLINCITAFRLPFEITDNSQFQRLINLTFKAIGKSIIFSSKNIRQQLESSIKKDRFRLF